MGAVSIFLGEIIPLAESRSTKDTPLAWHPSEAGEASNRSIL